jgi:uncharacterized membrane protein YphA (DoxX/SURF4 family)
MRMETTVRTLAPHGPAYHGYMILRVTFVLVPILSGLDKFFNFMVEWPRYLAPWVDDLVPVTPQEFMDVVGAIEIAAGLLVLISARWGSLLVAVWLGGIIVNLLTYSGYYDIALRDFGLFLAALALGRLALAFRSVDARQRATTVEPAHRAA